MSGNKYVSFDMSGNKYVSFDMSGIYQARADDR